MHDSGKSLPATLMSHHEIGAQYAGILCEQLRGQKIEDVEIDEEIKEMVQQAILHHMNHPFLVMLNKGRFPEPENEVDKIVFDADMLANIGFKNVGFRISNDRMIQEDVKAAQTENIAILEEAFSNVMSGVRQLEGVVLSEQAKNTAHTLIAETNEIFDYFKQNNIFTKIQERFSVGNDFNSGTIEIKGGSEELAKILNEEICKAGQELGIDQKIFENFVI